MPVASALASFSPLPRIACVESEKGLLSGCKRSRVFFPSSTALCLAALSRRPQRIVCEAHSNGAFWEPFFLSPLLSILYFHSIYKRLTSQSSSVSHFREAACSA